MREHFFVDLERKVKFNKQKLLRSSIYFHIRTLEKRREVFLKTRELKHFHYISIFKKYSHIHHRGIKDLMWLETELQNLLHILRHDVHEVGSMIWR